MRDIRLYPYIHRAITLTADLIATHDPLRTLLSRHDIPERLVVVLLSRGDAEETLVVDRAYLDFAQESKALDPENVSDLDLPRHAMVARLDGWPDSWATRPVADQVPTRVAGVWHFV